MALKIKNDQLLYPLSGSFSGSFSGSINNAISASYALTASHVEGIVSSFPFTGSAVITGSLTVTGSLNVSEGITGSFFGNFQAAGPTGSIQFNNSGSISGSGNLIWDNSNERLGINIANPSGTLHIEGNATSNNLILYTETSEGFGRFRVYNASTGSLSGISNPGLNTSDLNESFGAGALRSGSFPNTLIARNVAIGSSAMANVYNIRGSVAIGATAMQLANPGLGSITGSIAIGDGALGRQISGSFNIAIGTSAMLGVSSTVANVGDRNLAIGAGALQRNTTGTRNNALGDSSLNNNSVGSFNTANGNRALNSNTSGSLNTAVGFDALFDNTTGDNNIVLGHSAGRGITTGRANTIIGHVTGSASNLSNTIILADGDGNIKATFTSGSSGTLNLNSSTIITGSLNVTGVITGSLFGTASFASTASFIDTTSTNAFIQGGNSFGTQALLGTNDNNNLALETSGSIRMFISSSGNVGIGTTTPSHILQVIGTTRLANILIGSAGNTAINNTNNDTSININNGVGIAGGAIITPSARLQVRGSGATSSTTALRIENSNATASLTVLDNLDVIAGSRLQVGTFTPGAGTGSFSIYTRGSIAAAGGISVGADPAGGDPVMTGIDASGATLRIRAGNGAPALFRYIGGGTSGATIAINESYNPGAGSGAVFGFTHDYLLYPSVNTSINYTSYFSRPSWQSPSFNTRQLGIIRGFYFVNNLYTSQSIVDVRAIETNGGKVIFNGLIQPATQSLATGVSISHIISSSANNDVLIGVDINPTFVTSGNTGVSSIALRVQSGSAIFSNSNVTVTGSLTVTGGITGSLFGTASFANNVGSISNNITNNVDNRILTATGAGSINGESNLTFDGTTLTVSGNAIVTNNLTVQGTASFQNVTNLEVADRFVLFASGSNIPGDGGIVVQQGTQNVGELLGFDNNSTRWGFTSSFNASNNEFTPDAFVASAVIGTSTVPTDAPGRYQGLGNIFIGSDGEIWIYS